LEAAEMLIFVGLGLYKLNDLTLSGLSWMKAADILYLDTYTSIIPGFSMKLLRELIGKDIVPLRRKQIEEEGERILMEAKDKIVVLLVPGDPFVATTHMRLRLDAVEKNIETKVVHAPSIISAISGETGLFNYKFGRTVTIPFPYENYLSETPYDVVKENLERNLHTLLLLDADVERNRYMSINEALEILIKIEGKRREAIITMDRLVVGVARIGADDSIVIARPIKELLKRDFGPPPQSIIIPGRLHFIEAEALVKLAGAPRRILK